MKPVRYQLSIVLLLLSIAGRALAQSVPTTVPTAVSPGSVCPGGTITISANVTDDGRQAVAHAGDPAGYYWISYYNASTNAVVKAFQNYNDLYVGTPTVRTAGTHTASNRITGPAVVPNDLPAGTYYIRIFIGDSDAQRKGNASNSPTFTVNAAPTATISGGATVNYGSPVQVRIAFTGTGPWSFNYRNGTSSSAGFAAVTTSTNPYIITLSATGDYTYDADDITDFKNSCGNGSISGSASIKVNALKLTTTSVNPKTGGFCPNRDPIVVNFSVVGSAPSGTTYTVLISDQGGNFKAPNSSREKDGNIIGTGSSSPITCTIDRPLSSYDAGGYRVKVISNSAAVQDDGSSVAVQLSRPAKPTVKDIAYCQSETKPFQVEGQNLFWYGIYYNSTTDNRTAWDKRDTPPSPTNPGYYIYEVAQQVDGCFSGVVTFRVDVTGKSNPPSVSNVEYCQGEAPKPLSAGGQSLQWYDGNGNSISGTPTPPMNSVGTLVYKVSQLEGSNCRSDQATITVTIKSIPTAPTFTNPDPLCQGGNSKALSASGQNLQWYDASNNPISGAPSPPTTGITPLTYQVTQTVSGCTSPKASITQTFNAAAAAPTVTPASYCVGYTAEPLSARAQAQNPKWYLDGVEVPASTVPPTTEAKVITYKVTQAVSGNNCPSLPVDVKISILNSPTAPSVQDLGLCLRTAPSVTLDKRVTAENATLKWYDAQTGGTGSTTVPVPDVNTVGTKTYYVAQTNAGNCEGPRAALKVTIYDIPAAPTVGTAPLAVCEQAQQPVGPFTATGANLRWTSVDLPTGANQPPTTSPTAKPGNFTVAVTQTVNGCPSLPTLITQVINPAPAKPTATDFTLCLRDADKALSATALSGNTLRWYTQDSPGGTASATAPIIKADNVKQEKYYVSQVDSKSCESLQRQVIQVTVSAAPGAPTVRASQLVCLNTTPVALTAGGATGTALIWKGTEITDTTKAPTPSTATTRTYNYTVTQKLGSCISPASTITYTILPLPDKPTVAAVVRSCLGQPSVTLSATVTGSNTPKWYASEADAKDKKNAQTRVTIATDKPSATTWFVTQSDVNGCESTYSQQNVSVSQQVSAQVYGDGAVNFFDSTAIRIRFAGDGPWYVKFWDDTERNNITENPIVKWVNLKNVTTPTVTYTLKAISGACGAGVVPAAYTITVNRVITGVEPNKPTLSFVASPNPVTNTLRIEWSATSKKAVTLRALSATGHVVWQLDRIGTGSTQTESLPVNHWSAGLYFLQLKSDSDDVVVRKVIKQ
ncbi:hypothetical protein GCM10028807_60430 [Spirosoma daeguense]